MVPVNAHDPVISITNFIGRRGLERGFRLGPFVKLPGR